MSIRPMTDGTYHEPVRIDAYQPVNCIAGKLALEVAPATLVRPGGSHLLGQILQHVVRVSVQAVHHLSEIHNNSPSTYDLDLSHR